MQLVVDVSVIIPSYNIRDYLKDAVLSALGQENINVEVIVVDDCSTDGSLQALDGIEDPRLIVVKQDVNSGPGAARNKAISLAKGEWIAIFDGDDSMDPARLFRMVSLAKQQNADIVVDNLQVYRQVDGKTFPMFPIKKFENLKQLMLPVFMGGKISFWKGYPLGYLKPVLSRKFLADHHIAYEEDIRIGEDYLFLASALASGAKCVIDPSLGYRYTARIGSTSHRMSVRDMNIMLSYEEKFAKRFALDNPSKEAQRKRIYFMREMRAYIATVEALKDRNVIAAIKQVVCFPSSARFFWEPVWNRVRKLFA